MNHHILVIGAASMDVSVNLQSLPREGTTLHDGGNLFMVPGGMAATAAAALTRFGVKNSLVTCLGNDSNGKRLLKLYDDMGIDTHLVTVKNGLPTCTVCRIQQKDHEPRCAILDGAFSGLTEAYIYKAFEEKPTALYMTLELPSKILETAANLATDMNIPVYIDGGPITEDTDLSALPPVTVFSPNDEEAYALTGIRPAGTDTALMAAIELQKQLKADYYVIKLGERGAFIYDGVYCHVAAPFLVPVTDLAGAGDVFTAALCYTHLQEGDILAAARFANAAAALTIQKSGCLSALPTETETHAFLQKHTR